MWPPAAYKFEEEGVIIYKAPAGAMVVMNPQDGSVLAMASTLLTTLNYSFRVSVRMNLMTLLILEQPSTS